MNITREYIKEYLDSGFKKTNYFKQTRPNLNLEKLKTMTVEDLDFINCLKDVVVLIKKEYETLVSNPKWEPSNRQKAMLDSLKVIVEDLKDENLKNNNKTRYLKLYEDFYWSVWDYFEDYKNLDKSIYKEEVDKILPILEIF